MNDRLTQGWWDIENVDVPLDYPPSSVYKRTKQKLANEGFSCPLEIRAIVANKKSVPRRIMDALQPDIQFRILGTCK